MEYPYKIISQILKVRHKTDQIQKSVTDDESNVSSHRDKRTERDFILHLFLEENRGDDADET